MQSVAAAAGVAKATLYNHFRTKDEVAAALLAAELDRLTALAAGPPARAGAGRAVRRARRASGAAPAGRDRAGGPDRAARRRHRALGRADRPAGGGAAAWTTTARRWPARWLLGVVLQPGRSTDAAPARRPASRPCSLTGHGSGSARVSSTRSAPGPACPGDGARVRAEAAARAPGRRGPRDGDGLDRPGAHARGQRGEPRPAAGAATPRRRQAGWTARAWTTASRSALTTPSR